MARSGNKVRISSHIQEMLLWELQRKDDSGASQVPAPTGRGHREHGRILLCLAMSSWQLTASVAIGRELGERVRRKAMQIKLCSGERREISVCWPCHISRANRDHEAARVWVAVNLDSEHSSSVWVWYARKQHYILINTWVFWWNMSLNTSVNMTYRSFVVGCFLLFGLWDPTTQLPNK